MGSISPFIITKFFIIHWTIQILSPLGVIDDSDECLHYLRFLTRMGLFASSRSFEILSHLALICFIMSP